MHGSGNIVIRCKTSKWRTFKSWMFVCYDENSQCIGIEWLLAFIWMLMGETERERERKATIRFLFFYFRCFLLFLRILSTYCYCYCWIVHSIFSFFILWISCIAFLHLLYYYCVISVFFFNSIQPGWRRWFHDIYNIHIYGVFVSVFRYDHTSYQCSQHWLWHIVANLVDFNNKLTTLYNMQELLLWISYRIFRSTQNHHHRCRRSFFSSF